MYVLPFEYVSAHTHTHIVQRSKCLFDSVSSISIYAKAVFSLAAVYPVQHLQVFQTWEPVFCSIPKRKPSNCKSSRKNWRQIPKGMGFRPSY